MKFGIFIGGPEKGSVMAVINAILKALTAKGADQDTRKEAIRAIATATENMATKNVAVTGCSVTDRGKR